ncbi:unnamed protein product [Oikopleura dioica]|uniref:t-SNARE coiled-coil homology domain-containing protein n=1 Tax=Oikopleura dioica TaxID=34765 RepID=E4XK40_OIKDI|nr:unnamed protein product [Oikopleura dioica]
MSDSDEAPLLSQQQAINQQDQALDDLATIIRRQRDIGITIGNEVDDQNVVIDNITDMTENSRGRLNRNTENIDNLLSRDKGNCTLWLIVGGLFIVIIVLLSV